jgi:nicotinamidase-related amidase
MPHWIRTGRWACVEGTAGAEPPPELRPDPSERQLCKRFFSAFGNRELGGALEADGVDTLVIAGVYLHGCVRATVLDAYERGYDVRVAADAVGSTDAAHARMSRDWLEGRAATFMDTGALLRRLRDAQADWGMKRATAR